MKKIDPAISLTIVTLALLTLIIAFPRPSQQDDRTCADDSGCSITVVFNDRLSVIEGRVTKITMKLTAEQAAVLGGDPHSELKRVKSTLQVSSGIPRRCVELERSANSFLTLVVSGQAWQKTKGNKTPITMCDHLAPTSTIAAEES